MRPSRAWGLGVVVLVVCLSTVWLMVGADDGNLTQSMSIRTWLGADTRLDLALGLVGAIVVLALCRLAWSCGRMLDGPSATRALVVGTLLFQLLVILALQARDTYWGDSWMVSDFVDKALAGGVTSLFRGPYRTLFYDARLYYGMSFLYPHLHLPVPAAWLGCALPCACPCTGCRRFCTETPWAAALRWRFSRCRRGRWASAGALPPGGAPARSCRLRWRCA